MIGFLAVLYGAHITVLIYLFAYVSVRAIMGRGAAPLVIVLIKYLIYWKVIAFGFKHLPSGSILIGFTGSLYLSLPLLYLLNKKMLK